MEAASPDLKKKAFAVVFVNWELLRQFAIARVQRTAGGIRMKTCKGLLLINACK